MKGETKMNTRGLYGFRYRGEDKATYNNYDSYPDYPGRNILTYTASHDAEEMKRIGDNMRLVKEGQPAQENDSVLCMSRGWCDRKVNTGLETDWYCLLRNTQGNLYIYAK